MQCHTRACANVLVWLRVPGTGRGWMDAEEDGAGPSVVVVDFSPALSLS